MNNSLGTIELVAYNFAPAGWARCEGQILPIAQNTALFSLIATAYGGNGETTFALPNLPPLGPDGPYYCICIDGEPPARG